MEHQDPDTRFPFATMTLPDLYRMRSHLAFCIEHVTPPGDVQIFLSEYMALQRWIHGKQGAQRMEEV